ncbi:MAG: hypothetical protein LUD72_03690, partial [Bacteroidales bacterium]|nr:hypothetical protein [Bacteroidales bacterium]
KWLELYGVYPELCDGRYILLYLSVETTEADRDRLLLAFRAVTENWKCLGECKENVFALPKKICDFLDAVGAESEYVPLDTAKGRVSAAVAGIAPPCMPRILPGEEITEDVVKMLGGKGSFGIKDGKIKVVKG